MRKMYNWYDWYSSILKQFYDQLFAIKIIWTIQLKYIYIQMILLFNQDVLDVDNIS